MALSHVAGALPTKVLIASGLRASCASCRCSWWRPPSCPVLPSLLSASLMPAAPLGWGSGATEQSPPFLGQLCSTCRTRAGFFPLTPSFRLSSLSDAQHLFSFRCPSFSSCDCFCSGFRTQPPPAPAMLLYASLMGDPISQLSSPFIHELFPLIDGLGQPGELTYLTADSQDPLPQRHSLHFRADSVRKDLMRGRLPALFCSSALGYR